MWVVLNKNTKKIIWVIILLIVPAFFLWGVSGVFMSKKNNPVAGKINGKKIYLAEYMQEYDSVLFMAQLMYRENFEKIRSLLDFNQNTWGRIILLKEMEKDKIIVSKQELIDFIQKFEIFRTNGVFNFQKYNDIISKGFKMTHAGFEEEMEDFLAIGKLKKLIAESAVVSEGEVWENYLQENRKRKVYYVTFENKKYQDEAEVSEEEINSYFKEHEKDFEEPEKLKVKYIMQDFISLEKEAKIGEERIAEYYELNKKQYKREDGYRPIEEVKDLIKKRLLYEETTAIAAEKINSIYYALEEGKNFEELAKKYNIKVRETGFFKQGDIVPEVGISKDFSTTSFSLREGEFSEPVKTSQGVCIVVPLGREEAYLPSLEELKSKIIIKIQKEKSRTGAEKKAKEWRQKIKVKVEKEGFSFKEACQILKLDYAETDFFSKKDYVSGVHNFYRFVSTAFSLRINEISEVIEDQDKFLFLAPVFAQYPEKNDFEKQQETLFKKFQMEKEKQIVGDWIQNLYKRYKLEDYTTAIKRSAGAKP